MSHPVDHARHSVRLWGGRVEDYLPIHGWLDEPKKTFADWRHRALRHHSLGCFEAEEKFGHSIINSDGKAVHVRYICEQHIKEDCGGRIPSVGDWLENLTRRPWMAQGYSVRKGEIAGVPESSPPVLTADNELGKE
jgi:hypothetical protein